MKRLIFFIILFLFIWPASSALAYPPLFGPPTNYPADIGSWGITTGDFDEDGHTDLVVTNFDATNISIFLGNGNGTFATHVTYSVPGFSTSVTTGDFNEDGHTDLAVTNTESFPN